MTSIAPGVPGTGLGIDAAVAAPPAPATAPTVVPPEVSLGAQSGEPPAPVPSRRFGQSLWAIAYKETLQIVRDRRTLAMMLALPLIQLILFGYAVGTTVAHITTVVFDQSRDVDSRALVQSLVNTTYFDVVQYVESPADARDAIDTGIAKVAVIIAPDFSADMRSLRGGRVQVLIDGSDPNVAQTAVFAAEGVGQSRNAQVAGVLAKALGRSSQSVDLRTNVLYNPSLDATQNMVPGLIGLILQLVTVILTSSTIVRERERGTFEQLIVTPVTAWELLLGKMLPYLIVSMWNSGVILVLGWAVFGVEVRGNVVLLLALSAVFLMGALGMGLVISTISSTSAQAMQASIFTALPAFILSGFIFPLDSMPWLMRAIGSLLPLTYFLRIIRGIAMKGIGLDQLLSTVVPLTIVSVGIFLFSLTRFRKSLD
jgi:ABC-2 type transport system permease protein